METLRYGDTGTEVQLLQLALSRAGYREFRHWMEFFGNDTQRALERFQANHQLGQDGIAGSQTWAQLLPWLLGYRRVTLRKGDTFYRLAQRYGSTLRAIETANPQLDPLRLQIGQSVIVPLSFTWFQQRFP